MTYLFDLNSLHLIQFDRCFLVFTKLRNTQFYSNDDDVTIILNYYVVYVILIYYIIIIIVFCGNVHMIIGR